MQLKQERRNRVAIARSVAGGITQDELARRLGMWPNSLCVKEKQDRVIPVPIQGRIMRALGYGKPTWNDDPVLLVEKLAVSFLLANGTCGDFLTAVRYVLRRYPELLRRFLADQQEGDARYEAKVKKIGCLSRRLLDKVAVYPQGLPDGSDFEEVLEQQLCRPADEDGPDLGLNRRKVKGLEASEQQEVRPVQKPVKLVNKCPIDRYGQPDESLLKCRLCRASLKRGCIEVARGGGNTNADA